MNAKKAERSKRWKPNKTEHKTGKKPQDLFDKHFSQNAL